MSVIHGSRKIYRYASILLCSLAVFCLAIAIAHSQSRCDKKARVQISTRIWDREPQFNLGKGWQTGRVIGSLKKDAEIYICEQKNIGFGMSTQRWYRIAYWNGSGWSYGWITGKGIQLLSATRSSSRFHFVSTAYAVEFGSPPASITPPNLPAPVNASGAALVQQLPDRADLYFYLFLAMFLGMIAKIGFDVSQTPETVLLKKHLRRGLGSLFVSPIVFLSIVSGFGTALNIQENRELIVFLIFAFQNGFFWQNLFMGSVASVRPRQA